MRRNLLGTILVAAMLTGACDKKDAPALISQEDKELLERIKSKEKAKADLQQFPAKFIEPGKWKRFDKGIINDYTRATAIEFTNNSQFDVSDIKGKITYIDTNGQDMATVPFSAHGEVRAGASVELEVTAGEISGAAHTGRIVVNKVRIHG